jgi:hypothetical protein
MDLDIDCNMMKMANILKLQHLTNQFEKYHDDIHRSWCRDEY